MKPRILAALAFVFAIIAAIIFLTSASATPSPCYSCDRKVVK